MKLLVLGGTKFLGRAVVEAALARGHELTLFNRGETNPTLFPEAERLRGDRDGDLSALEGRGWDAVVDPSGYVPRLVRASAELLRGAVEHYTFVSSVSVYRDFSAPAYDESAPVAELADPETEDVRESYGALKALCERVVDDVFPGRSANVRAGLIVGPHDPTGRFTYWPRRIAAGGRVLAPAPAERQVQLIEARDLGDWIVRLAEGRVAGTFNATGPLPRATFGDLLETCRRASDSDAEIVWVDEAFLLEHEVGEWMELPLWLPASDEGVRHMQTADVSRAVAAGLSFRPLAETVRDTLAWAEAESGTAGVGVDGVGLEPERERGLLAAWAATGAS
ncbi:MAG: epimerase [Actinobacteria bacterium]|nr:epimerase [Actinomycetota bacterium]